MNFKTMSEVVRFEWSRLDVISNGITFEMLMIKLRHADTSWGYIDD